MSLIAHEKLLLVKNSSKLENSDHDNDNDKENDNQV